MEKQVAKEEIKFLDKTSSILSPKVGPKVKYMCDTDNLYVSNSPSGSYEAQGCLQFSLC